MEDSSRCIVRRIARSVRVARRLEGRGPPIAVDTDGALDRPRLEAKLGLRGEHALAAASELDHAMLET